MRIRTVTRAVTAGAIGLGTMALTSSAAFAGATHPPIAVFNPAIAGPPPPGVVPPSCPAWLSTDSWTLSFVSGNDVSYGTSNKNGDWGGGNAEGQGVLQNSEGTTEYSGHLHTWFGGGTNGSPNNTKQQSEQGFTLAFNGSGIAGNININANMHMTTNNAGVTTTSIFNANVTCS